MVYDDYWLNPSLGLTGDGVFDAHSADLTGMSLFGNQFRVYFLELIQHQKNHNQKTASEHNSDQSPLDSGHVESFHTETNNEE